MILYKLNDLEYILQLTIVESKRKVKTVVKLKELLLKIDHKSEIIPDHSLEEMIDLLEFLKGRSLSKREMKLLQEIV